LLIEFALGSMKKKENKLFKGRRNFLKAVAWSSIIPAFGLWLSASSMRSLFGSSPYSVRISSLVNGSQISGDYLIIKRSNGIQVFSAICTHLGCRLKDISDETIICPCHGSHFAADGSVIRGPALKPLTRVNFIIRGDNLEIQGIEEA
jgi:Rieske Fe-S protein